MLVVVLLLPWFTVLFSECLFGRPPYASKTFKELEEKIWDPKPVEVLSIDYTRRTTNCKGFGIYLIQLGCMSVCRNYFVDATPITVFMNNGPFMVRQLGFFEFSIMF